MIVLKTARELGIMKEACVISAQALKLVGSAVEPGVSTWELDQIAEKFILSKGAKPNFKGLYGYPATMHVYLLTTRLFTAFLQKTASLKAAIS